ncbi:bacillithiol biosynthesis cysteine-adding enzyme BshC [Salipaludibacillus keqinensis]|uniref:Putative cysteine ligase BshC n=1 Tax=Salipaludibacillus keqinensis TaxID=2045207 RepID=A0A323TDY0_9BACI|nr:bacillithiol biosynthesis cysteine-adding enzyme BshC [Salipaludibacillus keqinensis]PYZ93249.1 bacillithiol biosynthesis cysteine-adding enzyme BshC [Salipaludibacillus keqinensis]
MQLNVQFPYENDSFIHKYIHHDPSVLSFYDYDLTDKDSASRYKELMSKTFEREKVIEALHAFNKKFHPSERAYQQIERLKDPKSVTVVGGQQAGMLTGPLYTVHKIISILLEAKNLESQLQVPVIPIFWIAGEDHDIDEVNHTYFYDGDHSKKIRISERNDVKTSASERYINTSEAKKALKEAFQFLYETGFTKKLYDDLIDDINDEITYTEWCAKILHRLFKETDLVLMDAHDPNIRSIETPYFTDMVEKNGSFTSAFLSQAAQFKENGLGEPISIEESNAHLFFHEGDQRFLLERTKTGYQEKQGQRAWTEKELVEEVRQGRLQLSNNVVTRPVMQDLLLPVHTFIAGPGELKYWGVLKEVFHCFDRCMPIVRPRLHLTFITRKSEKSLVKYDLDLKSITVNGVESVKQSLIEADKTVDEHKVLTEAEKELKDWLNKVTSELTPLGKGMTPLNEQFKAKVDGELKTFEKNVHDYLMRKNETHLRRLDQIEIEISPHGNWQERYLNIYPFLNLYGEDLAQKSFESILESSLDQVAGSHVYIYL